MLTRLGTSALYAGFGAGLFAAVLQFFLIVPVILEAERYESGEKVHFAAPAEQDHAESATAGHDHVAPPDNGGAARRHLLTFLATTATSIGFALLLTAGFALAEGQGLVVTARGGLIWGLCGFLAAHLLPAAGLAPELPGMAGADLAGRQVWWLGTVIASAAGIAAFAFGRGWQSWAMGLLVILLPHLAGAPQPQALTGVVPPELSAEFAGRALAVAAAGWVILGLLAGFFWNREARA